MGHIERKILKRILMQEDIGYLTSPRYIFLGACWTGLLTILRQLDHFVTNANEAWVIPFRTSHIIPCQNDRKEYTLNIGRNNTSTLYRELGFIGI
jgi:hypothetical protein